MRTLRTVVSVLVLVVASLPVGADEQEYSEHLAPLLPLTGKTWRGVGSGADPEQTMVDVSRWELALQGTAIRVLHSVNDGEYGGETIIVWDDSKKSLVFFYFTTAGFFTQGTMTVEENRFVSHERVTGDANGITEVKAITELLPDGRLSSSSQYLQHGQWVDGHSFVYEEDPSARVALE